MSRHLLRLRSSYQDLCSRYGLDDPMVKDMKIEIENRESGKPDVCLTERHTTGPGSGPYSRQSHGAGPLASRSTRTSPERIGR